MGSSQRLAAVAAVSHATNHYNNTNSSTQTNAPYTVNILFVSATICGVLVAVCAAWWRRKPSSDKPEEVTECHGVYTVSADRRLSQAQIELPGPPPAYEAVVEDGSRHKDCSLQEVINEPCPRCHASSGHDSGLPSYEAAVLLKDTKL